MVILMDVDKLKRMNVLADTLKHHGLAATREDAANLAGTLVGKEQDDMGAIFECSAVPEVAVEAPEAQEIAAPQGIDEARFTQVMQSFANQFCAEINKLNEKIEQQDQQIRRFKSVLESQKPDVPPVSNAPVQNVQPEVQETVQAEAAQPVAQVEAPSPQGAPKAQESNPRTGGLSSDDVSIEKFFYFGTK
jgi:hypothetical protein